MAEKVKGQAANRHYQTLEVHWESSSLQQSLDGIFEFSLILKCFWCEDGGGLGDSLTLFGTLLSRSFLQLAWRSPMCYESVDGLRLSTSVPAGNKQRKAVSPKLGAILFGSKYNFTLI